MNHFSIKEALRQALLANSDLVALVGDRISASFAPRLTDADGPWLVISQVSGQEDSAHDGNAFLSRPRYQITIGGTNHEQVDQVRDVLVYQFNGATYDGYMGRTITFFYADDSDAWEDNTRVHRVSVDFYVWANTEPLGD